METRKNLLGKYYKGDTSLEEEKILKQEFREDESDSAEKDMFGFFSEEAQIPDNLEEDILAGWEQKRSRPRGMRKWLVSLTSAAAVVILVLTIFTQVQETRNERIEDEFFIMEQALFNVSESIKPQEQEELLVLWVDDNVEIIINQ